MRILLLQPKMNWGQNFADTPSMALLTLGTIAQYKGHEVEVYHLDIDQIDLADRIAWADLIGMTVNTFQVKSAKMIADQANGTRLVIGGPHAQAWDGGGEVVIGEGENEWLMLLGDTPHIHTIDDIPLINYELVDLSKFAGIQPIGSYPQVAIMASRGCPNECIFCNTPAHWGKKVRYRSPALVVDEVQRLHRDYGINEVFFQDDTFNLNHKWAIEIFDGLMHRGLSQEMTFRLACRVNEKLVTEEFLRKAYEAGVWSIFYGVESGSQRMLDRMKKGITVEEVIRAFRMTREAHINTHASFIVGLPGEDSESLRETEDLLNEIKPNIHGWGYACPFPNTEFYREVKEKGHMKDIPFEEYGYGMKCVVRTDALSYSDLEAFNGFTMRR